jgi:hypothetical protein
MRSELNGRNVEGCVRAAILTRDGGAAVEFAEGGSGHGALNGLWWSVGGGESSWARRSGVREGRARRWSNSGRRRRRWYPFKGGGGVG